MTTSLVPSLAIGALRDQLRGHVLTPTDAGYDDARRLWNGLLDRRPAAVARCLGPSDVAAAVRAAREGDLLLSVKSTGSSYAGHSVCDGGLVIDVSQMNAVHVDPEARTVRVGPGARWGAVDAATQDHGLATPGATVSTVGVTGFVLGGGTGHLSRLCGLGADNLRSADVVLASGEHVRASADEHADLFWALRGGSGNFGVVTALELALHEVGPEVLAGQMLFSLDAAPAALRRWRDAMAEAPDGLGSVAALITAPPVPPFPEAAHGRTVLSVGLSYAGDPEAGLRAVDAFRGAAEPLLDVVGPQPYVVLQQAFDAGMGAGHRWTSRAHYLDTVTDAAIDALLARVDPLPGPYSMVYFTPQGGAIGRVPTVATAVPHRDAAAAIHVFPGWDDADRDGAARDWARDLHEAMAPHANGGVYVNLLGPGEADRVPAAYGEHYGRLREVKRRYDPDNLFRSNHNVPPAA